MKAEEVRLVFQAYGSEDIFAESVLMLHSWAKFHFKEKSVHRWKIIVYTPTPEFYSENLGFLNIEYRPISQDQIREWKGKYGFVHRLKQVILVDQAMKYPESVILYLDTDTIFHQNIDAEISACAQKKQFYMHTLEDNFSKPKSLLNKKVAKFFRNKSFSLNGQKFSIDSQTEMWNAGVLLLPPQSGKIIREALAITDIIYPAYPKHVMEQLAFSYRLAKEGKLAALDYAIYHYWNLKELRPAFKALSKKLCALRLQEFLLCETDVDWPKEIANRTKWEAYPSLKRKWLKLIGKEWKAPKVGNLRLSYPENGE